PLREGDSGGGGPGGVGFSPSAPARFSPPLRQPPLGDGGEIPAALPVGIGSARHLGRQRGSASRLCHRHGAGGDGRQGSRAHSPPAHPDLRAAHPPLPHSRRPFPLPSPSPLPPPPRPFPLPG